MKATERILHLFENIYDGGPWISVTISDSLKNISPEQASARISPGRNTIWEIVNHVIQWRSNVLRRIQGEVIVSPEHNYFLPVKDTSETAWENTLHELNESQKKWLDFLRDFEEGNFDKKYPTNQMTYYEHIHGILQHDAYHLGQIVLLTKLDNSFKALNPEKSDMKKHHHVNYLEFTAVDIPKTKEFYRNSFGWEFTDYGPEYVAFTDGDFEGGFAKGEIVKGGPLVILYSENLQGSLEKVKINGGEITKPIFEFPGGKRFHFHDPNGNELAIWSDK